MTTINDPSLPLQAAVVKALKTDAGVSAIVVDRVFDPVPDVPTVPYVSIGEMQVLSEKVDCLEGAEVYLTLHAWSRASGSAEVKRLGRAIIAALDDVPLAGDGLIVNSCLLENVQYLADPDGLTSHGVIVFHILTD